MALDIQQRKTKYSNWRSTPKTAATRGLDSTNNCFGEGGITPPVGYKRLAVAKAGINDNFMRYYNWRRPHGAKDGISPGVAENQFNLASKIA